MITHAQAVMKKQIAAYQKTLKPGETAFGIDNTEKSQSKRKRGKTKNQLKFNYKKLWNE